MMPYYNISVVAERVINTLNDGSELASSIRRQRLRDWWPALGQSLDELEAEIEKQLPRKPNQ